ncbi:hypothetical protein PHYBLDRAFT_169791 [Phycomyces blakesleeanus NRRL 1555(-)]|uniref:Uncharacterized protein n=1 Tax=Phycomyces blakesleeanus (strain ATCC 8743b / DSM 1359 / FGSC 10004 / NBRC 33097 / NRRL 1555) TaxID=763407 RepID=A0A162U2Q5_PHYB8|nr:hypothetical protein PHYBLDRAFT_169791 [Phycomyces blakesleeanus NRRL 1555(-)]OAD71873.1 hypothetical protein PHYBLDRAFT_169791 [Phycomyces blakesleeanus NRRL 1555(-)]|eukprot:XP_018289913.1 hypothetical protein PHYBLDRAFT_169791 [Phycomyces blakesleeanus NRRL 1555(-)]
MKNLVYLDYKANKLMLTAITTIRCYFSEITGRSRPSPPSHHKYTISAIASYTEEYKELLSLKCDAILSDILFIDPSYAYQVFLFLSDIYYQKITQGSSLKKEIRSKAIYPFPKALSHIMPPQAKVIARWPQLGPDRTILCRYKRHNLWFSKIKMSCPTRKHPPPTELAID